MKLIVGFKGYWIWYFQRVNKWNTAQHNDSDPIKQAHRLDCIYLNFPHKSIFFTICRLQ